MTSLPQGSGEKVPRAVSVTRPAFDLLCDPAPELLPPWAEQPEEHSAGGLFLSCSHAVPALVLLSRSERDEEDLAAL
jgi:hypothetical protein